MPSNFKIHLQAAVLVLILAGVSYVGFDFFFGKREFGPAQKIEVVELMENEGVPSFTASSLKGAEVNLDSHRGKIVIVNFWASWCGPCIEEVPSLIKLVNEFKGEIQLIAISGDSVKEDIDIFLKSFPEFNANPYIHIIFDQDRSLTNLYHVTRLPESFIVGRDGKLVKKIAGSIDWHTAESVSYLKSLK